MLKFKIIKLIALMSFVGILLSSTLIESSSALLSQNTVNWFWTGDTSVAQMVSGDVNGDGRSELVTAGWYNDGAHWNAALAVWNATTLALINVKSWSWNDTQITSVAVGDVNGDGNVEIVTGGSYYNGNNWVAQLCVWNGSSLAFLGVQAWYWYNDTQINSVAVANITGTIGLSIIAGGSYSNGTNKIAQLTVWNGSSLALQGVQAWLWGSDNYINSVAVADINGTGVQSIVTGGSYFDGVRNVAQLVEWNATNLAFQNVAAWYWTGHTEIKSIAIANVTGGTALTIVTGGPALTIVTGGSYFDGVRNVAQLVEWNGASLSVQAVTGWYWFSDTTINSVSIGNFTGGTSLDIITAGSYTNGVNDFAQLADWNGANLSLFSATSWFTIAGTSANAAVVANGGLGNRVYSAGTFYDTMRSNGQIAIWV